MKNKYSLSTVSILLIFAILCSFLTLPVSAAAEAESKALAKIDSALLEKMETALPDEKIPVAIWYKDIDQDNVDELTAEKVGFTQDDIALTYEMPSTELLSNLEKGEAETIDEMQTYLKRTEAKRKAERERTNEYVMTRREFSREKYVDKTAKVIKDLSVEEKNITFKSQYSPMIIAEISVSEINKSIYNSNVEMVYLYEELEETPLSIETAIESSKIDMINTQGLLGLTGEEIKVGSIEVKPVLISEYEESVRYTVPDNDTPEIRETSNGISMADYGNVVIVGDSTYDPNYQYKNHAGAVADTLYSVAPNIKLYSSNTQMYNIEGMIADGVQILTRSVAVYIPESSSSYCYYIQEKWYDHLVSTHHITTLVAAGNTGNNSHDIYNEDESKIISYGPRVASPGLAYNVITVGSYCDTIENQYSPNTLYISSSYKNSITRDNIILPGCEKPDVIAPASFNGGGTSQATPFLAGMIALMYELKPSLASYPQAVKAIVLASCHKKVTQLEGYGNTEQLEDGITDRQGAGAPDAWSMMTIVCQGTYGIGVIDASTTQTAIRFTQPSYGATNMNISLTWLKNNNYETGINHTEDTSVDEGAFSNLNLHVYRNGSLLKSSNRVCSSTEMTYFQLNSSYPDYEIRINKNSNTTEDVRYGFAYSTDNMLMTEETNEGVYRLKNLETGTYLTLDASTGELKHQSYADSSIQEWIVRQSAGCQISSAYGTTQGIINRSSTALNTNNYKAVLGNNTLNFSMLQWYNNSILGDKGGVVLYTYIFGTQVYLDHYSNYVTFSSGTSNSTDSKIWILERVNYIRGDANADGEYNINDATLVQKYLSQAVTLNNLQLFLADANYDGSVTIKDVSKIQRDINPTT